MASSRQYRVRKLKEAVRLTAKPENEEEAKSYNKNMQRGIGIFDRLCLSSTLTPNDKLDVLVEYIKSVPDAGLDMLSRWRDMLLHLAGKENDDMVDTLVKVTRCPSISSHERIATAVCLYNNCMLHVCYDCFADLACDRSVLVDHRVDACRYLFATQNEDYLQISQESLLEVVDTDEYPSSYRYKIIAGFISRTGISTKLNMIKLRVPYDEDFVYGLQVNFFYNERNDIRERILSGQHLLQMKRILDSERSEVLEVLLSTAQNAKHDDNTRADAADVILRLGDGEAKKLAREIIVELGFGAVDATTSGSLLSRKRTIYTDRQNIHEFGHQIDTFIEKIINETSVKIKPFHDVHQEVSEHIRRYLSDKEKKFKAFKALNRISIDTARFTRYKVTLAEIFVHVWARICTYEKDIQEELKKRMTEELIDMSDTCSSGHSGRFINVLSEHDISLKISWEEQVRSNIVGRMTARVRDCKDQDLRLKLAMANSELAEDEDRKAYAEFIRENIPSLKEELYNEFVGGKYTSGKDFEEYFNAGVKGLI